MSVNGVEGKPPPITRTTTMAPPSNPDPDLHTQIVMWAVAALKGTKPAHYRGCTKSDMFELIVKDERRVYVVIHNIDGPGGLVQRELVLVRV